ncbi:hypothetical protein [Mycolicibacterium houstonense]|nr:hypothetical protein [Mycolicibacterium houstonense]
MIRLAAAAAGGLALAAALFVGVVYGGVCAILADSDPVADLEED